ncbi:hypothetical protein [Marinisporobacter balticus]|nr:hypothetical protein [Marinisporobacter balticus]
MSFICKTCGNIIKDPNCLRCPRCHTIIKKSPKCEDCKGCSLKFKDCK